MSTQVKVYAGGETLRKWNEICESYTSKTAAFAVMVENYYQSMEEGKTMFERAKERVEGSEVLAPHSDFILNDWYEGDEHLKWVATAPESEILDWVIGCGCGGDEQDDEPDEIDAGPLI